jgi:hypothetical protein
MSFRRATATMFVAYLPLLALILIGSLTGHLVLAIFVVIGLLVAVQVVATVLSIRRSHARAKRP